MSTRKRRPLEIKNTGQLKTTYNIPNNVDELFDNGENNYSINNTNSPMDNIEALIFFAKKLSLYDNIIHNEGTMIIVEHEDFSQRLEIHSSGLGDMFNHRFDVYVN